ncbi:MAG: FadR/GntR family transcriptional regulator [Burkholderiaceae bacterium]
MMKNRDSLTDRVAEVLIGRILDGSYPVGGKLPAGRLLAQEFDVSAAVIREATERLRTKGLVKTRQGAGCIVLSNTLDDGFQLDLPATPDRSALLYIYELRAGVEGAAASLAAQRATDEDLARMDTILARLKSSLHVPAHALELDLAFHRNLAEATHNPHYPQLLAYLSEQWRHSVAVARRHTFETDAAAQSGVADAGRAAEHLRAGLLRAQHVHEEHEAILAAIRARDPQAARDRAHEHLRQACARLGLGGSPSIPSTIPIGNQT